MTYTVPRESMDFSEENIASIEKLKKAKYLFDSSIGRLQPIAIFYAEVKHPEGSNFFGLHYKDDVLYIMNSHDIATSWHNAILTPENELIHSRYVHDYRGTKDGSFIDGGREYLKTSALTEGSSITQFKYSEEGKIIVRQYTNNKQETEKSP